jgi:hypothetical protein
MTQGQKWLLPLAEGNHLLASVIWFLIFGDNSEEDPPVPIPNTEVKLFSADGTARVTVWESRSSPNPFDKPHGV